MFLWSGSLNKGLAAVAWKDICKPKREGGLGLLRLDLWNKAAMAKHVWAIATKQDSLWIKWVHSYHLKGSNFWQVKASQNDEWCWKKILQIRDEIRPCIKVKVGNGEDTSFWLNNWLSIGPISSFKPDIDPSNMASHISVAKTFRRGAWRVPGKLLKEMPTLEIALSRESLSNVQDRVCWAVGAKFSVASVYCWLTGNREGKPWHHIV
jgi:hypothetical protein